ncbi:MAG: hypothetical protein AAB402_02675 [Patescibacteria group bacterium]
MRGENSTFHESLLSELSGQDRETLESPEEQEEFLHTLSTHLEQLSGIEERVQEVAGRTDNEELREKFVTLQKSFNRKMRRFLPLLLVGALDTPDRHHEGAFHDRARASLELSNNGITTEQREAYKPGLSDLTYRLVTPKGYQSLQQILQRAPGNLADRENVIVPPQDEDDIQYSAKNNPDREDAWKMYLGLPQKNNTFGISEFRPDNGTEDKYYYRINDWALRFSRSFKRTGDEAIEDSTFMKANLVPALLRIIDERNGAEDPAEDGSFRSVDDIPWKNTDEPGTAILSDAPAANEFSESNAIGVMGAFKVSKGQDEHGTYISYYDRWDLGRVPLEGKGGFIGKPYEIYDRVYYNPWSKEIVPPDDKLSLEVIKAQQNQP